MTASAEDQSLPEAKESDPGNLFSGAINISPA
jgi:hypothetical protein